MGSLRSFVVSEDGAVTVDWVILASAVVGLSLIVAATVRSGVSDRMADVSIDIAGAN